MKTASSFFPFHNKSALSIAVTFAFMGAMYGSWIARLPDIQTRLNLSESEVGVSLMGLALGNLLVTPLTLFVLRALGTGRATFWSTIFLCFAFTLPTLATGKWMLAALLGIAGMSMCILNISMNSAAGALEKRDDIKILSSCHAMFSVGLVIGATSAGWFSKIYFPFFWHIVIAGAVIAFIALLIRPIIIKIPNADEENTSFTLPSKSVIGLGIICTCFTLGEGAVADWSAIYLRDVVGSDPFVSSLGLAIFATGMAIGRFGGDKIRTIFSSKSILTVGGGLTALGLLFVALFPVEYIVIGSLLLAGLSLSSIVPILYSESTKIPDVQANVGLASVATFGTMGFMLGPPIVGFISEAFGLVMGFGFLAFLAFFGSTLMFFRRT
jgi:predicted MFS family arabinose efflux permease